MDTNAPVATVCEVSYPRTKKTIMKREPIRTLPRISAPQFYQAIRESKSKQQRGACMLMYISSGARGGLSDCPPDVREILRRDFALEGCPLLGILGTTLEEYLG